MTGQPASQCGAELHHVHGVTVCDLPEGHDGQHGAWCSVCLDDGYTDPSDRLDWERDGETWLTVTPAPTVPHVAPRR